MNRNVLTILVILLAAGAFTVSLIGVIDAPSQELTTVETVWGTTVQLYGNGIYRNDSLSYGAQARGQDAVTLLVGVPLLVIGMVLYRRKSLRGELVMCGSFGYMLYTYGSYAYLSYFNSLYLLYVMLFSVSLFGFILSFRALEHERIRQSISPRFPRKTIAVYLLVMAGILFLMWIGRIVPALTGNAAPAGIDHYSTLVIQTNDLGIIVPAAVITGILLLREHPFGYTLVTVLLMKMLTMGLALVSMMIVMALSGVPAAIGETVVFAVMLGAGLTASIVTLVSIGKS